MKGYREIGEHRFSGAYRFFRLNLYIGGQDFSLSFGADGPQSETEGKSLHEVEDSLAEIFTRLEKDFGMEAIFLYGMNFYVLPPFGEDKLYQEFDNLLDLSTLEIATLYAYVSIYLLKFSDPLTLKSKKDVMYFIEVKQEVGSFEPRPLQVRVRRIKGKEEDEEIIKGATPETLVWTIKSCAKAVMYPSHFREFSRLG